MNRRTDRHLANALAHPHITADFGARDWEALIGQARTSDLLGQLAEVLRDAGDSVSVPEPVRFHLDAALRIAAQHR